MDKVISIQDRIDFALKLAILLNLDLLHLTGP